MAPESPPHAGAFPDETTTREEPILARVRREGALAWADFLEVFSGTIFRVVSQFADSYDERMDLFLHVCARLREKDMKRVRSFRIRPEAPCRFSTYLSVVARNLAVDFLRSKEGRYRPFRRVAGMDEADRLLFEYHVREGRSLEEARSLLQGRHGIHLGASQASVRAARISASLSANQRWKLLSRLAARRRALSIDPVTDSAAGPEHSLSLKSDQGDPERSLQDREAEQILRRSLASLGTRRRLALILRFRDSLAIEEVARTMGLPQPEARLLIDEGLRQLRMQLAAAGIRRRDLESAGGSWLGSEI